SPQQKVGEIVASSGYACTVRRFGLRGRAGEAQAAARILLAQKIELYAPKVAAHGDIVRPLEPHHRVRNRAGLIAQETFLPVAQPRITAVEREVGRPPILRILIVAGDSRLVRYVGAVGPVRRIARRV